MQAQMRYVEFGSLPSRPFLFLFLLDQQHYNNLSFSWCYVSNFSFLLSKAVLSLLSVEMKPGDASRLGFLVRQGLAHQTQLCPYHNVTATKLDLFKDHVCSVGVIPQVCAYFWTPTPPYGPHLELE